MTAPMCEKCLESLSGCHSAKDRQLPLWKKLRFGFWLIRGDEKDD